MRVRRSGAAMSASAGTAAFAVGLGLIAIAPGDLKPNFGEGVLLAGVAALCVRFNQGSRQRPESRGLQTAMGG
jgi:hypothetical protein